MTYLLTQIDNFVSVKLEPTDYERYVPKINLETADDVGAAKIYLAECDQRIAELLTHQFCSLDVCKIRSLMIDCLVTGLFQKYLKTLPSSSQSQIDDCCLIATGGYGRQEMSIYSDIDLLFLHSSEKNTLLETLTQKVLYVLWDLSLEVGYAVRNIVQCKKFMREDETIYTALIDARFLSGNPGCFQELVKVRDDLIKNDAFRNSLLKRKMNEREDRIKKYGSSVYICEPNLKEGDGGLRDLQLIRWVAKFVGGKSEFVDFYKEGLIDEEQFKSLEFAFEFFLRLRNEIHAFTRKKSDHLTFDYQEYLAAKLGFVDVNGILAVERFMQSYYTNSFQVSQITRVLTRKLLQKRDRFKNFLLRLKTKKLGEDFKVVDGQVVVRNKNSFETDPLNLLEAFKWVQQTGLSINEDTKEAISANLFRVNDEFRARADVCQLFKEIMGQYQNLGQTLFAMHEVRFFDALIPEFRKIRNRVQHDVYHVYTIDTHSIFAVNELSQLVAGAYGEKFANYKKALLEVKRPDLLTFGLLFHDVGKGEGGNHSVVGAKIANGVTKRLGYSEEDQRSVEFLVISHLLMPHLSQRRDLEDPQLITEFASSMKTLDNLNMLYLLTWGDIRAVGPEAWTDWKGTLLDQLYDKTRQVIAHEGLYEESIRKRIVDIRQAILSRMKSSIESENFEKFLKITSPRYVLAHTDAEIYEHFHLIDQHDDKSFLFTEKQIADGSVSEILLYTLNNPRVLGLMTGVMLAMGINILAMDVSRLTNGYVFVKLHVQSDTKESLRASNSVAKAEQNLKDVFSGKAKVDDLLARRKKPQFLMKKPVQKAENKVMIDNDVSAYYTVIDYYTHDRLGLLFDIVKCLSQQGCYVEVSKISTKVEQVVDSFYVKDIFGHKITSKEKLNEIKKALLELNQSKDEVETVMPSYEINI